MTRTAVASVLWLGMGAPALWAQDFEDLSQAPTPVMNGLAPSLNAGGRPLGSLPALEPSLESPFVPTFVADDGRRTMGQFVPNLGRNLAAVVSPRNVSLFAVGAGISSAGSFLDRPARDYFAQRPRAEKFGQIGATAGGARIMAPLALSLFAAGRFSRDTRFRAATYDLGQAMIVTQVYTTGLKMTVGRARPDGSNRLSFPSGHTSSAFTFATVVDHHYGRKVGIAAYTAAGLIGLSRMERGKHHASDVLAGAALGWISARTVVQKNGPVGDRRQLSLVPLAPPSGAGAGLGVNLTF